MKLCSDTKQDDSEVRVVNEEGRRKKVGKVKCVGRYIGKEPGGETED